MTIYNVKITAETDGGKCDWVYHFDTASSLTSFVKGILAPMDAQEQYTFDAFESSLYQEEDFDIDNIPSNGTESEEDGFVDTFAELHCTNREKTKGVCYNISISKYETI